MISLREHFYHNNERIEITQPIEVISVHDSLQCRSRIAIRTNFTSLRMQLDIDAKFIFTDEQIQILKDKEKRDQFFKTFLTSSKYGL